MKKLVDPTMKGIMYPVGDHMNINKIFIKKLIKLYKTVEEFKGKPVNVICTGSSGAIIASALSMALRVSSKIYHVKKPREDSHHGNYELMDHFDNSWLNVIVDDFIGSGHTINRIYSVFIDINHGSPIRIDCVATCGYDKADRLDFKPNYFLSAGLNQ